MNKINRCDGDYQSAVGEMVSREVLTCASTLVNDLCNAGLYDESCSFAEMHPELLGAYDYEQALLDNNITESKGEYGERVWTDSNGEHCAGSPQEACDFHGIEPYYNECLEFWIVSEWLADKLEAKGQCIDRDVHGLTIWGRFTSGQAILLDNVICEIYNELHSIDVRDY